MAQPGIRPPVNRRREAGTITCGECGLYRVCFAPRLGITAAGSPGLRRVALRTGEALPALATPAVCAVRAGALERQHVDSEGEGSVAGYRLPGELVTLAGPAPAGRWLALRPTRLCALSRSELLTLLGRGRQLPVTLTQMLLQASEAGLDALQTVRRGSAVRRVASLLVDLRRRLRAGRELHLPMSRRSLASHLDLTLATASRTLSMLEAHGILRRSGRFVALQNPHALQALAAGHPLSGVAGGETDATG